MNWVTLIFLFSTATRKKRSKARDAVKSDWWCRELFQLIKEVVEKIVEDEMTRKKFNAMSFCSFIISRIGMMDEIKEIMWRVRNLLRFLYWIFYFFFMFQIVKIFNFWMFHFPPRFISQPIISLKVNLLMLIA